MLWIAVLLLGLLPANAESRCHEDGPNSRAVAVMRAQILESCACCELGSRHSVMRCVAPQLKAAVRSGRLSRGCAGRLMREQTRLCRRTECRAGQTGTTTTVPMRSCARDEDCDDDNACTSSWCAGGECRYACDRCGIAYPDGGGFEWICCSPPRDDCPPLPPTTTSTTLPVTCEPGECRYYRTCGWPVCPSPDPPLDVPTCTTQAQGQPCTQRFEQCDAGFSCGAVLLCTDRDPLEGSCPISVRSAKRDIHYLDTTDVEQLRDALLRVKLARWRYRTDGEGSRERLGFIIDDLATGGTCESPAVMSDGSHAYP